MWLIQTYRPSNIYLILFPTLLIISICILFYDNRLSFATKTKNLSLNNYLRVELDLTSNTAICQLEDHIIIYILSTVTNFKRRNILRSTWASPSIGTCFVFVIGKIDDYNSIESIVINEKQEYKDIIQIDHIESYTNVIYKEIGALQWSSHFYPLIPYLFKTDDDLIVDSIIISAIARILATNLIDHHSYFSKYRPILNEHLLLSDRSTFFRGGWPVDFQPTLRYSKFAVSENAWEHPILPLYCSGFGWFMSKNIRNKLVQAASTYPLNKVVWIGDVFLSGFLAKVANVNCTGIAIDYEQTSSANCSCLMVQQPMLTVCSSTFHGGGGGDETIKYEEYEKAWKVIVQRHSLIDKNITDIDVC